MQEKIKRLKEYDLSKPKPERGEFWLHTELNYIYNKGGRSYGPSVEKVVLILDVIYSKESDYVSVDGVFVNDNNDYEYLDISLEEFMVQSTKIE